MVTNKAKAWIYAILCLVCAWLMAAGFEYFEAIPYQLASMITTGAGCVGCAAMTMIHIMDIGMDRSNQ